jgi:uncharacterized protein
MLGHVAKVQQAFRSLRFATSAGGAMTQSPDLEHLTPLRAGPTLDFKFVGTAAEEGTISGYVSAYGAPADSYGDLIQKGAFDQSLTERHPALLWCHDLARPVGKWDHFRTDDYGLHATGRLNLNTSAGREAFEHLKAGDVGALSIGYQIAPGGFQFQADGTRLLTKIDLFEASVVPIGACRRARVTSVKSLQSQRDLEHFLHDEAGLPRTAAKAIASRGFADLGAAEDDAALTAALRRIDQALTQLTTLKG